MFPNPTHMSKNGLKYMKVRFLLTFLMFLLCSELKGAPWKDSGHILFLVRKGQETQAFTAYKQLVESTSTHHFDLLHQIGLALLDQGSRQSDPEMQLMAIFGASVSLDDEVYYILEEGLKKQHPQIQLVALNALAKMQNDRADRALLRALSAEHPLIRLEALSMLCQKKHPQASTQAESLMVKVPKVLIPLFPQLFASIGDDHANKVLRRLLSDSSEDIRVAAILSVAEQKRDDFLPQIRQLITQFNFSQQEVCAKALGIFHDEKSKQKLERLRRSQYTCVSLAANEALVRFGDETALDVIKKRAGEGDLFAIRVLGSFEGTESTLLPLLDSADIQVRINATISLLEREDPRCIKGLNEILIHDKRDLGFSKTTSPGGAFTHWKANSSAGQIFQEEASLLADHLELRETLLTKTRQLSEKNFLEVANLIFSQRQQELVPKTIALLIELQTNDAILLLKKYQQHLGAPLVRHYCNLALYKLNEEGPYEAQLKEWVKNQKKAGLFQFRPLVSWEKLGDNYSRELTPEETSNLLIQAYEIFTFRQDKEGLEILLEAIQNGNPKNKYVLAGILVRATQ